MSALAESTVLQHLAKAKDDAVGPKPRRHVQPVRTVGNDDRSAAGVAGGADVAGGVANHDDPAWVDAEGGAGLHEHVGSGLGLHRRIGALDVREKRVEPGRDEPTCGPRRRLRRRHRQRQPAGAQPLEPFKDAGQRRRITVGVAFVVRDVAIDEATTTDGVIVARKRGPQLVEGGAQMIGDGGLVDAEAEVVEGQARGRADDFLRVDQRTVEVKDDGGDVVVP